MFSFVFFVFFVFVLAHSYTYPNNQLILEKILVFKNF